MTTSTQNKFELYTSNQRLHIEPARAILTVFKIQYEEKQTDIPDNFKLLGQDVELDSPEEIIIYLSKLALESDEYRKINSTNDTEEVCKKFEIIKTYYKQYEEICQIFHNLQDNTQYLNIFDDIQDLGSQKFILGDNFTPADLLLFEILNILEETNNQFKDSAVNKYLERVRSIKNVQSYYLSQCFYLRPWNSKNMSKMAKSIIKLKENQSLLSHMATIGGLLYAKNLKLEDGSSLEFPGVIPVSLTPVKADRTEIERLVSKQELWGKLIDSMARDFDWYSKKLEDMIRGDPFIARLFQIAKLALDSEHNPKKWFCVIRNDFMNNAEDNSWLQVEFNNIAVGFSPMSDRTSSYHKDIKLNFLKDTYDYDGKSNLDVAEEGLISAFKEYDNPNAIALIVVPDEFERNVFDQRMIQQLFIKNKIDSLRITYGELVKNHRYDESNGKFYCNDKEVGLVYFRTGYMPYHYINEDYWKLREIIECSAAMKCPNVHYQLVNFKIFQYHLTKPENLERFLPNQKDQELIRENFARFYDIGTESEFESAYKMVEENPEKYVLKPSREGGGNNYFSNEILVMLKKLTCEERKTYCLMQKIEPNPRVGLFFRDNKIDVLPSEAEIGVYSYILSDPDKMISSKTGGILARSKKSSAFETGVSSGNGVIDSLEYL